MNYINLNGKKINLTDEQVKEIQQSFGINSIKLADVQVGETFKISKYEFVVLYKSSVTAAVILKDLLFENEKFGSTNNYENSNVDKLCGDFADEIANIIGNENFVEHCVDLTSDDGLKDYGKIKRRVSLLTTSLYRKYVEILDNYKIDKWWWLATAFSTLKHEDDNLVKCVSPPGCIFSDCFNNSNLGVRPFCILNSNIFVSKGE
ncbi:MAG: hypothetical protein ACI4HO_09200 [Ruminococcus sp.]